MQLTDCKINISNQTDLRGLRRLL